MSAPTDGGKWNWRMHLAMDIRKRRVLCIHYILYWHTKSHKYVKGWWVYISEYITRRASCCLLRYMLYTRIAHQHRAPAKGNCESRESLAKRVVYDDTKHPWMLLLLLITLGSHSVCWWGCAVGICLLYYIYMKECAHSHWMMMWCAFRPLSICAFFVHVMRECVRVWCIVTTNKNGGHIAVPPDDWLCVIFQYFNLKAPRWWAWRGSALWTVQRMIDKQRAKWWIERHPCASERTQTDPRAIARLTHLCSRQAGTNKKYNNRVKSDVNKCGRKWFKWLRAFNIWEYAQIYVYININEN